MTPLWLAKHQNRLPALFIPFFSLTLDPNTSSLRDNQLRSEINNVRSVLASTNYKTKLLVILLGDGTANSPDVEDRLNVLRRATSLDAKTLLFVPGGASPSHVVDFTHMILSSVQSFCIEYYRDLSKHARRKRNRSTTPLPTIPPSSGTSQILPLQGWNVRYEFKLGVFAEFRQEMDAAGRNYESSYEALFTPELLESVSSWSPRFNEARLLADVIAVRIIRCQLWTGQTTGAVRSWLNHRSRIQDLVDRRGKGTENYGWEAWETTWARTMSQLIERADAVPLLNLDTLDPLFKKTAAIFAVPEKALPMGERVYPWEMLHHQGYWLWKAQKHIKNRRALALQMPEEDRASPGDSPASVLANKAHLYDTYLTPEPHVEYPMGNKPGHDYASDIVGNLNAAVVHFSARNQLRAAESIELEIARERMKSANWDDALTVLRPLWSNVAWRTAGWWSLLAEVGWALEECALKTADAETLLRVAWELHNKVFMPRQGHRYDLGQCLRPLGGSIPRPALVVKAEETLSCVTSRLCFDRAEGHVGEPLKAQLVLQSHCQSDAEPLHISEVKVVFDSSLRSFRLVSESGEISLESNLRPTLESVRWRETSVSSDFSTLQAQTNGPAPYIGLSNLTIGSGQTKIYDLSLIPREAGDVNVASMSILIEEESFSLASVLSKQQGGKAVWWEKRNGHLSYRRIGKDRDATTITILPKPPKLLITAPNLRKTYYTNENINLQIELLNKEEDAAIVSIEARLISPQVHLARIKWSDDREFISHKTEESSLDFLSLSIRDLGIIARSGASTVTVVLTDTMDALDHELEITSRYTLKSEPETPLKTTSIFELPFVRPFEANYEFLCRYDLRSWPNFFEPPMNSMSASVGVRESSAQYAPNACGILQKYSLLAKVYSFATEAVVIEDAVITMQNVIGGAVCHVSPPRRKHTLGDGPDEVLEHSSDMIKPDETQNFEFFLDVQKHILGDRHVVGLDLALEIRWRREDVNESTVSVLEIPRYLAPMAEPRVLLMARPSSQAPVNGLRHLTFIIENPSMHFLTFSVTMESSEDFAFSGPKASNVSLVPLSRHTVEYRIVSSKSREWVRVNFGVVDAYFGKTLKVNPANELVRSDKKHNVSVWID